VSADAQIILKRIADDPAAKPHRREEARAALTLFSYLEMTSVEDLITFLLDQCSSLQERIDYLEKLKRGETQ
jgi:hypothetical protein